MASFNLEVDIDVYCIVCGSLLDSDYDGRRNRFVVYNCDKCIGVREDEIAELKRQLADKENGL